MARLELIYRCSEDCGNSYSEIQEVDTVIKRTDVLCVKCSNKFPGFSQGNIFAPIMSLQIKVIK